MTREIKFRAWNKKYNIMISWEQMKIDNTVTICFGSIDSVRDLMQYTGLKDKNGTEIYEGDIMFYPENEENIMEMQNIKKPVIFERGAFRIDVYEHFKKVLDDETASEGEVIGNIYQNKELLK